MLPAVTMQARLVLFGLMKASTSAFGRPSRYDLSAWAKSLQVRIHPPGRGWVILPTQFPFATQQKPGRAQESAISCAVPKRFAGTVATRSSNRVGKTVPQSDI